MKTSTDRILTTHVGSIPRPESIRELLRARLEGRPVDAEELAARVKSAVPDVVREQAECGIDIVSDGEMSKTSFIAYTDERLTGGRSSGPWPRAPSWRLGGYGRSRVLVEVDGEAPGRP